MAATPVFAPVPGISRKQINRAGETLRHFWAGRGRADDEVIDAFTVMIEFRETFQGPLNKTVSGLRSMVCSEWTDLKTPGASIPVVQRLKRREQIMSKLVRIPGTQLSNMGDIGGCRAILANRSQVDGVVRRIRKNWDVHGKVRDTRDEPTESGYRAMHVLVVRDGRRIEVQLRTPREHEWAVAVERTGSRLGIPLKEGQGPADLREYFQLASRGMYLDERGEPPEAAFVEAFERSRRSVRHYFQG